jgi:hypothetical protein
MHDCIGALHALLLLEVVVDLPLLPPHPIRTARLSMLNILCAPAWLPAAACFLRLSAAACLLRAAMRCVPRSPCQSVLRTNPPAVGWQLWLLQL